MRNDEEWVMIFKFLIIQQPLFPIRHSCLCCKLRGMEDSIFTKIIKGEIPCHKIYEDEQVMAILDIHPIRPGHTLVVPKKQIDHFDDLDETTYQDVFKVVKIISKHIKKILGAKRACLRVEGFDIPHVHIHVIPCNVPDDFYNSDRNNHEPDHSALASMAAKLKIGGNNE